MMALLKKYIPEMMLVLLASIVLLSRINFDFWNDEIYTLKHFVFSSIKKTLTDYHVPNNHILSNSINNVYLKCIGIDGIYELFDHPWKLRIVLVVYSFMTLYYTYKIGARYGHRIIGLLAGVLLYTFIPFVSFTLQTRGYGLSMALSTALVYYTLRYIDGGSTKDLIRVGLGACLLFYSIPSNLYFIGAIITVLGIHMVVKVIKEGIHVRKIFTQKQALAIYTMCIGLLIGIVLYIPVLESVFGNDYVKTGHIPSWTDIKGRIDYLVGSLFKHQLVPLLLMFIGLIRGFKSIYQKLYVHISYAVVVLPFLFVLLSGQNPPIRIYTVSIPFISIIMASCIYQLQKRESTSGLQKWSVLSFVSIFAILSYVYQSTNIEEHIKDDIVKGWRSQDLYHQYYSARYWPLDAIREYKATLSSPDIPVTIDGCEPHGISNYLDKFGLPYQVNAPIDSLLNIHKTIHLITNHPNKYNHLTVYTKEVLNKKLSYHNIVKMEKAK